MNCTQFQERISSAVDSCLPSGERMEFDRHAEKCPRCRRDFEQETSTKVIVGRRAHMVDVPPHLQRTILDAIDNEAARSTSGLREQGPRRQRDFLTLPVIAVALSALVVALLITKNPNPSGSSFPFNSAGLDGSDVIGESLRNFHGILSGEIAPQMRSSSRDDLFRFFSGRTEFPVIVPEVPEWKLVGAALDNSGGTAVAHLVYENNGDIVCVSQACWETVRAGKSLRLSPEITSALVSSGRFVVRGGSGDAVVLWTHGRGLCVAVAHMDRDTLLQHLLASGISEHSLQ